MIGVLVLILFLVAILFVMGVRIVQQYERGVVFRLGKVRDQECQPGLRWIVPFIDHMRRVSLRIVTMPVQSQKIITKDNVSVDVAAVAYFFVHNPTTSIVAIEDVNSAIYQVAQTTVRNVVGQFTLDEVLSDTEKINQGIMKILDAATEAWGVQVKMVELKDIQLPDSMQRAMAKQAEAEREKRAKIIAAEGEKLSAEALGDAADVMAAHPIAMQLRNLQTLAEIAVEKNSTIVFPSQLMDSVQDVKRFIAGELGKS